MKKLALGAMRSLEFIRPPDPNYGDWRRFLEQCREAGVSAIYVNEHGKFVGFSCPLGMPLLRRWRWLQDAEDRGLAYEDAEAQFGASIERDRDALREAEAERVDSANRATAERERQRKRDVENAERGRANDPVNKAVDRLRPGWRET